jgi:hypothetical protein
MKRRAGSTRNGFLERGLRTLRTLLHLIYQGATDGEHSSSVVNRVFTLHSVV